MLENTSKGIIDDTEAAVPPYDLEDWEILGQPFCYSGAMAFELWNMETGNLIGSFATEGEALEVVRQALGRHGRSYVERLFLGREDRRGRSRAIAAGSALVERALATADGQAPLAPAPR